MRIFNFPRRLFSNLVLLLLGLFGLLALGNTPTPQKVVVRVGIYNNLPLHGMGEDNQPQGLYVDILTAIAEQENWELSWQLCNFDECLTMLENQEIDLLGAISYSPESASLFDFSEEAVLTNWGRVYTPKGSGIESWFDLDGQRVVLLKKDIHTTVFKDLVQKFSIQPVYVEVDTYDEVFATLRAGGAEAGLVNRVYGENHERQAGLRASPIIFNPVEIMFAFPKGTNQTIRERIDADLRAMKAETNSVYQKALRHWLDGEPTFVVPPWLLWGLAIALAGMAIFFTTSLILQRRVQNQIATLDLQNKRLQAEIAHHQATQQTLRLHTTALEAAANAIVIMDREGIVEWVNPAYTRLTGYEPHEIIGKPFPLLSSEDVSNALNNGQTWQKETLETHKDGHTYFQEVVVTPIQNQDGVITHFIAIQQDISERKQRERSEEIRLLLAESLGKNLSLEQMGERAISLLSEIFEIRHAALSLIHSEGERILFTSATWQVFIQKAPPASWPRPLPPDKALACPNVEKESSTQTPYMSVLRLQDGNKIIGHLWLGKREPFPPGTTRLLEEIEPTLNLAFQRAALLDTLQRQLRRINALHSIDLAIASSVDQKLTLNIVSEQIFSQVPVDGLAIYTYDAHRNALQLVHSRNLPVSTQHQEYHYLMPTYITTVLRQRQPMLIPDLREVTQPREQIRQALHQTYRGYACFPLIAKGRINGVLELYSLQRYHQNAEWQEFVRILNGQVAIALENAALFNEVISSKDQLTVAYESALLGWSRAMAIRHHEPLEHAERTADLCLQVAQAMGYKDEKMLRALRYGAWLHDVGKLGVPEEILHKSEPFSGEECAIYRTAPNFARHFLADIPYLDEAMLIPYHRTERWDGQGYPQGLSGENIPIIARIFSVVHYWDARSEPRHYALAKSVEERLAYLKANSEKRFDPQVVSTLLDILRYS